MNERIDQLWAQALDAAVPETYSRLSYSQVLKIKQVFAELIIRECVKQLKETKKVKVELPFLQSADIKTIQELPLSVYTTDLLEHFGVEE